MVESLALTANKALSRPLPRRVSAVVDRKMTSQQQIRHGSNRLPLPLRLTLVALCYLSINHLLVDSARKI